MPEPGPIRPVRFFGEHPNKRQKWPKSEWSPRGFVVRGDRHVPFTAHALRLSRLVQWITIDRRGGPL